MQELIAIPIQQPLQDDSDQQALELFNNLNGQLSQQHGIQHLSPEHLDQSDGQIPQLRRLSKLKKESKKDKKKRKMKDKLRLKKQKKHRRKIDDSAPRKKVKRQGSTDQKNKEDQSQIHRQDDRGSSEFDSQSDQDEGLNQQFKNLNPDYSQESNKKRLRKSGHKQKIQAREGFRISQLGNDAQINGSQKDSQDEQYVNEKKKKKKEKVKVKVPTNEQIMNIIKLYGAVESQGQDDGNRQYDRGLDMLHSMKDKRQNNIRINNRLFGDLEFSLQKEQAEMAPPQNFQLELRPKNSTISSQRGSFLSKAESIKKQRGLEADVNIEEYQRKAQEKAKQSIAKMVSSMVSQDFHDDIDVSIRVPTIARGRSADIINNTVFLRKSVNTATSKEYEQDFAGLMKTKTNSSMGSSKRDFQSRQEMIKQMQQETRLRRSKFISDEQLKNSFKKTNLEELEEARKRIQEKKRKEAYSESNESEQQEIDHQINEMIEKEERICGDLKPEEVEDEAEQNSQQNPSQQKNENEIQKQIHENEDQKENLEENELKNQNPLNDQNLLNEQNGELNEQNGELNQYNELLQELISVQESQANEQQSNGQEGEQQSQQKQILNQQNQMSNSQQLQQQPNLDALPQPIDFHNEKQMKELEDEGIIVRKRRNNNYELNNMNESIHQIPQQNKNILQNQNLSPQNEPLKSSTNKIIEEENEQQFNNFKKLRKIAFVMARKKKQREQGRKYASQYIQHQAEQGSDNEEHDDMIKNIDDAEEEKQYQGIDLDADLVELIDNAVDINEEDQYEAFRKYLEDARVKDREEIKKIIRGQFWKKHEDLQLQVQQDQRQRQERMDEAMNLMKMRQQQDGKDIYIKSPERPQNDSEEDSEFPPQQKKQEKKDDQPESQQIPHEEQMTRLERFLEETMPTIKKEYKPVNEINLLPLPQCVKRDSKASTQKTISMSKFGSRAVTQTNPLHLINRRNTSSLINQILNKTTTKAKAQPINIFNSKPKKAK